MNCFPALFKAYQPFFKYLRPYRWTLVLATVCGIIAGLSSGIGLPFIFNNVLSVAFVDSATNANQAPAEISIDSKAHGPQTLSHLPLISWERAWGEGQHYRETLMALPGVEGVSVVLQPPVVDKNAKKSWLDTVESWFKLPGVTTEATGNSFPSYVVEVKCNSEAAGANPAIPKFLGGDVPVIVKVAHAGLGEVVLLAMAVPLMFLIRAVFGYLSGLLAMRVAVEFARGIQQDVFDHVQAMPMSFFDTNQRGDLQNKLNRDTMLVQSAILDTAPELLRQPFTAVSALVAIIALSVHYHEMGFVVAFLVVAPVCMVPVRLLGRKLRRRSREWAEHSSSIAQHIWENFNGIHEIRSFSLESAQQKGFAQKLHFMLNTQFKIKKYLLLQQPSMELVVSLLVSGIFVYACLRGISFATFTAFGLALYMAFDPIKRIGQALNTLHQTEPNADRLMEFFSIKPDIQDPPHPKLLDNVRGEITFANVTFAYGDEPVLRDVSITIPAGCTCALVGRSGAGKSTFAKLIPRFYEVRQGSVMLDGTDVRDVRQADLRRHVAVVSQHPVLFDMPILENIRLGRPGATDAEVMDAAKRAYADSFIRSFPEGYNTLAGDRGDRLSGGQKQRIALARAFLKNAPVLLLDEAVSALDSESEQAIMAALNDLAVGRTVLTIAHRLSTIRNSKLILVFDQGRLAAQGTHAELMKNSPIYAELVNRQLDDTNAAE